jgi:hypothetical protein
LPKQLTGLAELMNFLCFLCHSFGQGVGEKGITTWTGDVLASLCADECECWKWNGEIELCLTVLPMCLPSVFSHDFCLVLLSCAPCLSIDEIAPLLIGSEETAGMAVFQTHHTIVF